MFLHKIASLAKDIFLPSVCCGCGKISAQPLCPNCLKLIERHTEDLCSRCGYPLTGQTFSHEGCAYCRQREFYFFRLRSYGPYKGVLKRIISAYKYGGVEVLAEYLVSFFAELFHRHYANENIDLIETVPSFLKNKKEQGFLAYNPMQRIALKLSIFLDLPYGDNIIKIRKTLRQKELDLLQRKINLDGCFKIKDSLHAEGKNILLIDDVMTSSTTLNILSLSLKRSGADKIFLLTLARAM